MLEPEDLTDAAAEAFAYDGNPRLHLQCEPHVYFRAKLAGLRHSMRDREVFTEREYLEQRDEILKTVVAPKPRLSAFFPLAIVLAFGAMGAIAYGFRGHLTQWLMIGSPVATWATINSWANCRYISWHNSLSAQTRHSIVDYLSETDVIDINTEHNLRAIIDSSADRAT